MLIQLGYEFRFNIPTQVSFVAMLHVHPSRAKDLQSPDVMLLDPAVPVDEYTDSFGNLCSRFVAPPGQLRIWSSSVIADSGERDPVNPDAREVPVQDLPSDALRFLLNSRYCETDLLSNTAAELFWPSKARLEPRASRLRLGVVEDSVRLRLHASFQNRNGRLYRANRRVPRLSAPGYNVLPLSEHTGALRDWLPDGYWR